MLTIRVGGTEAFDDEAQKFVDQGGTLLQLEHSLVSLSKWESIFEKPFLGKEEKSPGEVVAYVKAMTLTPNVPAEIYAQLSEKNFEEVNEYIERKSTATWFADTGREPASREVVTAELIYYWMVTFNIPWEAQYWHLNRLFTLIRVCNVKSSKPKKMSRQEMADRNRRLNEERKKQLGTSG